MAFSTAVNSQITAAVASRLAQIAQLQGEVDALQSAARALGGTKTARTRRSAPKTARKTKTGRAPLSAAARKAVSVRMKASWARRTRARG